jgi:heme-degrading monooxygenase HmoA
MKHVRIGTYNIKKGNFDELVDLAAAPGAIGDIYKGSDGFVQFGIGDVGGGQFVSMTLWDSRASAEQATETARTWVASEMSDRIELVSNVIGDYGLLVS